MTYAETPKKMKMALRNTDTDLLNTHSECFFRTRTGAFKQFNISIVDGVVQFGRPKKGQESEISYNLNSIQVAIGSNE